ncbi:hypothetical protein JJB09_26160 [Rhizobium sp. KVB221]|uniref:Uncharacterized protein n=1 Tax=Rhizobium setariae TaxID=2801340 RepID=A0A936YWE6_9HYPH|nr:hypothetical protein [Rhizobium setariae]MBL0375496.1 hypothetical protein [Rhizobium setariae]
MVRFVGSQLFWHGLEGCQGSCLDRLAALDRTLGRVGMHNYVVLAKQVIPMDIAHYLIAC